MGGCGLATSSGQGAAPISATSNSISSSTTITVGAPALVSIAIAPSGASIPLGTSQPFTAIGTYTDGSTQDLTSVVTWSSSDANVAIISNAVGSNGVATSSGQGAATITATSNSISNSTLLTIGEATFSSIAVTPLSIAVASGYGEQFTATATYSDGSTSDVTQSATWSSSTPALPTVPARGLPPRLLHATPQLS